jgi:hypothetical protein
MANLTFLSRPTLISGAACALSGLLLMSACSSSAPAGFGQQGKADGGAASSSGTTLGEADGGGTSSGGAGCSPDAAYVYVLSKDKGLYRFDPPSLTFTEVGKVACEAGSATPNSMAVDRQGTAYVNYSDGSLFKVDTKTARCESTPYDNTQLGWTRMGMAFATNAKGSDAETLYVTGLRLDPAERGFGLGKIDLSNFRLERVGEFSGALRGEDAELTGTGDARLFGFYETVPASLAEIDRGTAATVSPQNLGSIEAGRSYAFSFWGGDFWFYTSADGVRSKVTRFRTQMSKAEVVIPSVNFAIVGAGVSTCAPLTSVN